MGASCALSFALFVQYSIRLMIGSDSRPKMNSAWSRAHTPSTAVGCEFRKARVADR